MALPAFFGSQYEPSVAAMERSGALEETLRDEYDVAAPESWPEYLAEAGGVMGAQIPVPSGMFKGVGALGRYVPKVVKSGVDAVRRIPGVKTATAIAGAIPEFMLPIRASETTPWVLELARY